MNVSLGGYRRGGVGEVIYNVRIKVSRGRGGWGENYLSGCQFHRLTLGVNVGAAMCDGVGGDKGWARVNASKQRQGVDFVGNEVNLR